MSHLPMPKALALEGVRIAYPDERSGFGMSLLKLWFYKLKLAKWVLFTYTDEQSDFDIL
ncbi:hypothetical protein [Psychroflexus sediminis]|uniref:hypothetical protein n=1 Tax=Psychroflexus sediminis TaxID=470826 RepID=UPI0015A1AE98|nr:hypothetical protein [Psychroflexus sediminis]